MLEHTCNYRLLVPAEHIDEHKSKHLKPRIYIPGTPSDTPNNTFSQLVGNILDYTLILIVHLKFCLPVSA